MNCLFSENIISNFLSVNSPEWYLCTHCAIFGLWSSRCHCNACSIQQAHRYQYCMTANVGQAMYRLLRLWLSDISITKKWTWPELQVCNTM